jgi:hypothetical protein
MAGYFAAAEAEQRKRAATTERDAALSRNAYARFLSQTRGAKNLEQVGRQWKEKFHQQAQGWGARGMLHSGQYVQGLQNLSRDRFDAENAARLDFQAELRGFDDQDRSANAAYKRALADIEMQQRLAEQQAAAQLTALKPFLG